MHGLTITLAAAAGALLLIGLARIAAWVLDRREGDKARVIRDAAFVAQARAELSATGWTEADEQAYQALRADSVFMRSALREVTRG